MKNAYFLTEYSLEAPSLPFTSALEKLFFFGRVNVRVSTYFKSKRVNQIENSNEILHNKASVCSYLW